VPSSVAEVGILEFGGHNSSRLLGRQSTSEGRFDLNGSVRKVTHTVRVQKSSGSLTQQSTVAICPGLGQAFMQRDFGAKNAGDGFSAGAPRDVGEKTLDGGEERQEIRKG